MKRLGLYLLAGIAAGAVDLVPMLAMKLTRDANLSAFAMWVVVSLLLYGSRFKPNPILRGLLVSFLVLTPNAILIAWKDPISIVPVLVMTTILGSALGFATGSIDRKVPETGPGPRSAG